eukprot:TRINITY_DN2972_c0_g1_i9.p1 TRINITY_DN2972_c0_g1~~TRINITY_DN2972_c0_g1_i9.p1  ORF type:complete len:610 (-),score=128.74 TRINITY_DN2972_c0_g1_i9:1221-3050(-)
MNNRVTVYGSGLHYPEIGEETVITIAVEDRPELRESNIQVILTHIETKKLIEHQIFDNGDHTFDVEWIPPLSGEYQFLIFINGEPVPKNPFKITALGEGEKVPIAPINPEIGAIMEATPETIFGPGFHGESAEDLLDGGSLTFTVAPVDLGLKLDDLQVDIQGPEKVMLGGIYDNGDHTFDIEWSPNEYGIYYINIKAGNVPLFPPVKCNVLDGLAKATAEGEGLACNVPTGKELDFTIYPSPDTVFKKKDIRISIADSSGKPYKYMLYDNDDKSFDVEYQLNKEGEYWINLMVTNKPVRGSPFHIITAGIKENERMAKQEAVRLERRAKILERKKAREELAKKLRAERLRLLESDLDDSAKNALPAKKNDQKISRQRLSPQEKLQLRSGMLSNTFLDSEMRDSDDIDPDNTKSKLDLSLQSKEGCVAAGKEETERVKKGTVLVSPKEREKRVDFERQHLKAVVIDKKNTSIEEADYSLTRDESQRNGTPLKPNKANRITEDNKTLVKDLKLKEETIITASTTTAEKANEIPLLTISDTVSDKNTKKRKDDQSEYTKYGMEETHILEGQKKVIEEVVHHPEEKQTLNVTKDEENTHAMTRIITLLLKKH